MARLFTYVVITIGILALFYASGIYKSSFLATAGLMPDDISNVNNSWLYTVLVGVAILLAASSAISLGFFGQSISETAVTATLFAPLAVLISSLASISTHAGESVGWVGYLVWLILSPLIVGYLISLYDWVRGRD